MTLRQYIAVMSVGTAICGAATALIIFSTDPNRTELAVFIAFYSSLFLTLTGLMSLVGFALRLWLLRTDSVIATQAAVTFRQGILAAAAIIIAILLNQNGLLGWLNAALLLAVMILLEVFLLSLGQKTRQ